MPRKSPELTGERTYSRDCCGDMAVPRDQIATVIAYGIETAACCACRGVEPEGMHPGIKPIAPAHCGHCRRTFKNGDTCRFGGCPMGGDF